jgi:hypothetical protein
MMAAAQRIPEGLAVTTRCWDDPDGMPTQAYAAALADAVYAPCPRGNDSVDCYRIWEALEAGAIPIVEDDGRFDQLLSFARVPTILQLPLAPRARWNVRYRARFAKSYWFSMFGEEFPLPRIHRWQHLPGIVAANDPAVLSKRVNDWWDGVKQHCRQELRVRLSPLTQHLPHLPAQAAP